MGRHKGHDKPHGTKGATPKRNGLDGQPLKFAKSAHRTGTPKKLNPNNTPVKFDRERQKVFLTHFQRTGLIQEASDIAGISSTTVQNYRATDPIFSRAMEEAHQRYVDILRKEIHRRGVEGVLEPLIGGQFKDQVVARVRKFDTTLLLAATRKHDPSFKEKIEVDSKNTNTNVNANVDTSFEQLKKLDASALEAAERLLTVLGSSVQQESKKAELKVSDEPSEFSDDDIMNAIMPEREEVRKAPDYFESSGDEDGAQIGSDGKNYDKDGKPI